MKELKFNVHDGVSKCVASYSTDWSLVEFFEIPAAYKFTCKWCYTVESYAGNRLYKYPETREVVQTATYVSVTTLKKDGSIYEIKVCDKDRVEIQKKNLNSENLTNYNAIVECTKSSYVNSREFISDVKIGDHIICYDDYSHDYVEHELLIESIEVDKEEGIILYGKDLTYPESECENYLTRVSIANFLRIVKEEQ